MSELPGLLRQSLQNHWANMNFNNELVELLQCVYKDLENERGTNLKLQEQVQNLVNEENFDVTSKCAALKDECVALKEKIASLTSKNDDLTKQIFEGNQAVKLKDEEVEKYKKMLVEMEQKMHDEVQFVQAAFHLETERSEIEYKREIDNYIKKSNDNLTTCNILRNELLSAKKQFAEYKRSTNQKIRQLQQSLREKENQPIDTVEKIIENASGDPNEINLTPAIPTSSKFEDVNKKRKNYLPPLIQVTPAKSSRRMNIRKNLYTPDDSSYLRPQEGDKK